MVTTTFYGKGNAYVYIIKVDKDEHDQVVLEQRLNASLDGKTIESYIKPGPGTYYITITGNYGDQVFSSMKRVKE